MTTPTDDIKNYTWRDKEYYKLYQRELYKNDWEYNAYANTVEEKHQIEI